MSSMVYVNNEICTVLSLNPLSQARKGTFGMNGSDHPSLCYKTGNVDMLHSHSIEPF